MIAYALIFVQTFINLFESVFIKKYSRKAPRGRVLFLTILGFISASVFVLTDRNGITITPEILPYSFVAAFFYCTASLLTFIAFQIGSYALTNLLLSYSLVLQIIYGLFFLNERLSVFGYIGIVLMLVSIFLVREDKNKKDAQRLVIKNTAKKKMKISAMWVVCVTLSVLGCGLYGVIMKMQQVKFNRAYDNEFAMLAIGTSSVAMLIISLCKERSEWKKLFRKEKLYAVGGGISNGLTNLLGLIITAMIPLSVFSPASAGIKILFTFLISKFVFHEKHSARQIAGVVAGGISLVLLQL